MGFHRTWSLITYFVKGSSLPLGDVRIFLKQSNEATLNLAWYFVYHGNSILIFGLFRHNDAIGNLQRFFAACSRDGFRTFGPETLYQCS
jgi:hypothetical protein